MNRLDRIEQAAQRATPGPWECMPKLDKSFVDHGWRRVAEVTKDHLIVYACTENMVFDNGWKWGDDGPYLALLDPGYVLLMVAAIRAAREELNPDAYQPKLTAALRRLDKEDEHGPT